MNSRQVATGTFLTASLLLAGASVADASPGSRPAMDLGMVPCERMEHRIDGLEHALSRMDHRRARLEARLAEAEADGEARRVRRLRIQLAQVARAEAKLSAPLATVEERHAAHCDGFVQPE